ncbi:hypothetical protein DSO57_1023117 [Entomophthora muscae]|uniref:Uncharacterized protein n=1 Tax=Entomophthora muscae TaxID=34485 RepID=A0ACC2TE66_9FUNG|nr:hypothetical protein DSO57_1023117 [Entomophthora muscae]
MLPYPDQPRLDHPMGCPKATTISPSAEQAIFPKITNQQASPSHLSTTQEQHIRYPILAFSSRIGLALGVHQHPFYYPPHLLLNPPIHTLPGHSGVGTGPRDVLGIAWSLPALLLRFHSPPLWIFEFLFYPPKGVIEYAST